jgi:hypothetical protein
LYRWAERRSQPGTRAPAPKPAGPDAAARASAVFEHSIGALVDQSPLQRVTAITATGFWGNHYSVYSAAGAIVGKYPDTTNVETDDAAGQIAVDTPNGRRTLRKIALASTPRLLLNPGADPGDVWIRATNVTDAAAQDAAPAANERIAARIGRVLTEFEPALRTDIAALPRAHRPSLTDYKNLLLDQTAGDIQQAAQPADEVRIGRHVQPAQPHGALPDYLAHAITYTACFDAAERLLTLLGANNVGLQRNGGQMPVPDVPTLVNLVGVLTAAMTASDNAGTPTVFRIEFAAHGFALIVRENRVEHLQSFAHESILMESIVADRAYTVGNAIGWLGDMASNDPVRRRTGAHNFGWNSDGIEITDKQPGVARAVVPQLGRFRWWSDPMATLDVITERVARQIQNARQAVLVGMGVR